ncbi:hypothetical protein ACQEU3_02685 [Spirillospora sp. CA-253888]
MDGTASAREREAGGRTCFAWEVQEDIRGGQRLGPCGVSGSEPGAVRALTEALGGAAPGAVGEVWAARPSQTRAAVFVYEGLVARIVVEGAAAASRRTASSA